MDNKKKNTMKKAGAVGLAAALLVTGSLAWRDVTQHKTNNFKTQDLANSVVLVEDFEAVDKWEVGKPMPKTVFVRNGQDTDNIDDFVYNDGYIRLQLREFLGLKKQTFDYSDNRYMIDTDGNYYRFPLTDDGLAAGNAKAKELTGNDKGLSSKGGRVEAAHAMTDGFKKDANGILEEDGNGDHIPLEFYYIRTAAGDDNGQYGKHLVTGAQSSDIERVDDKTVTFPSEEDLDASVINDHQQKENDKNIEDKDKYLTHLWDETDNFESASNKFSEYISLTLGDDVITLQQWKDKYDSKPVAKWILDTEDTTNGYVYWGQRLTHQSHNSVMSITSNLLEKVTLTQQMDGQAIYRLHVNMEAVSYDDLSLMANANADIVAAYKGAVEAMAPYQELKALIAEANEKIDSKMYEQNEVDALEALIPAAQALIDGNSIDVDALKAQIDSLKTGISNLVELAIPGLENPEIGKKFEMNGVNYTIIAEQNGMHLVLADVLTIEQYEEMNIPLENSARAHVKYVDGLKFGNGYEESYLKLVDEAFYRNYVQGSKYVNLVQPVKFNQEIPDYQSQVNWMRRTDEPTKVTPVADGGEIKAFSLSVSDYNVLKLDKDILAVGSYSPWLRSPGMGEAYAAVIGGNGEVLNYGLQNRSAVRPAMWMKLGN